MFLLVAGIMLLLFFRPGVRMRWFTFVFGDCAAGFGLLHVVSDCRLNEFWRLFPGLFGRFGFVALFLFFSRFFASPIT